MTIAIEVYDDYLNYMFYSIFSGIIAATSDKLAQRAADLVKVCYKKDENKPILTITDALTAPESENRVIYF